MFAGKTTTLLKRIKSESFNGRLYQLLNWNMLPHPHLPPLLLALMVTMPIPASVLVTPLSSLMHLLETGMRVPVNHQLSQELLQNLLLLPTYSNIENPMNLGTHFVTANIAASSRANASLMQVMFSLYLSLCVAFTWVTSLIPSSHLCASISICILRLEILSMAGNIVLRFGHGLACVLNTQALVSSWDISQHRRSWAYQSTRGSSSTWRQNVVKRDEVKVVTKVEPKEPEIPKPMVQAEPYLPICQLCKWRSD